MTDTMNPAAADLAELTALLADAEPAEIPSVADHPLVVAATKRHAELSASLADVRAERADLETQVGAGSGLTERQLRARLLVAGKPDAEVNDALDRLRALKDRAGVLGEAVTLAAADVQAARQDAVRELTPLARERVYLPAAREAARRLLEYLAAADQLRAIVFKLTDAGLGYDVRTVAGDNIPSDTRDRGRVQNLLRDLVSRRLITRDDADAAFPWALRDVPVGREAW